MGVVALGAVRLRVSERLVTDTSPTPTPRPQAHPLPASPLAPARRASAARSRRDAGPAQLPLDALLPGFSPMRVRGQRRRPEADLAGRKRPARRRPARPAAHGTMSRWPCAWGRLVDSQALQVQPARLGRKATTWRTRPCRRCWASTRHQRRRRSVRGPAVPRARRSTHGVQRQQRPCSSSTRRRTTTRRVLDSLQVGHFKATRGGPARVARRAPAGASGSAPAASNMAATCVR